MKKPNMRRVYAKARPSRIDAGTRNDVAALTRPEVFDRWNAGLRAAAEPANNVITIFDIIGEDYWSGGGFTAKRASAALRAIGTGDVEVHINSPGGDMFEGIAIYNILRDHPGNVHVKIFGIAASAASVIAMAGDTVEIGAASFLMIHNCWVVAQGNRHDMAETATYLEPFDAAMADVYASRTGQTREQVVQWMDAERYIGGTEAVELGFADSLLPSDFVKEDKEATQAAAKHNAARQAEIAMCSQMSRTDARALIKKLKGTANDAAQHDMLGAVDTQNAALAAALIKTLSK